MSKKILIIAIFFSVITCINTIYAKDISISSEQKAVLDAIIQAYDAKANSYEKGTGEAVVTNIIKSGSDIKRNDNNLMRFWFEGKQSRTDISPLTKKVSDENVNVSLLDDGESYFRNNRFVDSAIIFNRNEETFKGKRGEDFSTNIYFNWVANIPLRKTLSEIKEIGIAELKIEFIENNLLRISGFDNNPDKKNLEITGSPAKFSILLDPSNSYHICNYHYEQENVRGPGSSLSEDMDIKWENKDISESYPKSFSYKSIFVYSPEEIKRSADSGEKLNEKIETSMTIDVKEFNSDTEINPEVFTLKGIGIKNGTVIDDRISGLLYRYGGTEVSEASLQRLFNSSVEESVNINDGISQSSKNTQLEPNSNRNNTKIIADDRESKNANKIIIIGGLVFLSLITASVYLKKIKS